MKIRIILTIIAISVLGSCTKSDIGYFEATPGINFLHSGGKSFKYTFMNNPDVTYIDYKLSTIIIGNTADYDREFKVVVIPDSTTATSNDYQITECVVKANEFNGYVSVRINNNEILKDNTLRLWLEIADSKDFVKGNIENRAIELFWENRMSQPANWKYYGFGPYSTTVHKFMISILGVSYLEYGYPDDPNVPNVSGTMMKAYQAKMRAELKKYNQGRDPKDQLRHEDGEKVNELVVIP